LRKVGQPAQLAAITTFLLSLAFPLRWQNFLLVFLWLNCGVALLDSATSEVCFFETAGFLKQPGGHLFGLTQPRLVQTALVSDALSPAYRGVVYS